MGHFPFRLFSWIFYSLQPSHVSRDQLGRMDDLLQQNLFTTHSLEPNVPPVLLLRLVGVLNLSLGVLQSTQHETMFNWKTHLLQKSEIMAGISLILYTQGHQSTNGHRVQINFKCNSKEIHHWAHRSYDRRYVNTSVGSRCLFLLFVLRNSPAGLTTHYSCCLLKIYKRKEWHRSDKTTVMTNVVSANLQRK